MPCYGYVIPPNRRYKTILRLILLRCQEQSLDCDFYNFQRLLYLLKHHQQRDHYHQNSILWHHRYSNKVQSVKFLNIACYQALKTFKNGKNVHVSVHSPDWWMDLLKKVWYNKHHEWTTVYITFEEVEERFVSSGIFKTNVLYSH